MRRTFLHRLPVFAFATLLAFKAAVPMLASAAAAVQGKPVAEICDVYGVTLPAPEQAVVDPHAGHAADVGHAHADPADATSAVAGDGRSPPQHDPARHGAGDHCALTGLAALAGFAAAPLGPLQARQAAAELPRATRASRAPDSAARWAALLGHGPPPLS